MTNDYFNKFLIIQQVNKITTLFHIFLQFHLIEMCIIEVSPFPFTESRDKENNIIKSAIKVHLWLNYFLFLLNHFLPLLSFFLFLLWQDIHPKL